MWPSTADLSTADLVDSAANSRGAPGRARNALRATVDAVRDLAGARATQAEAEAGAASDKIMTPLRTVDAIRARDPKVIFNVDIHAAPTLIASPGGIREWQDLRNQYSAIMLYADNVYGSIFKNSGTFPGAISPLGIKADYRQLLPSQDGLFNASNSWDILASIRLLPPSPSGVEMRAEYWWRANYAAGQRLRLEIDYVGGTPRETNQYRLILVGWLR